MILQEGLVVLRKSMISIIVPIYNVEKYLRKCIDSILSQTYSDFEVLLIDDGSKDQSGEICDEYAARDSRVRVFHKENGGVSSARNLGIEQAKGEWITFIDSDDWVDADYLANFTMDSDLCVQGYYCGETRIVYEPTYITQNVGLSYMKAGYVSGPYCKLFNADVIRSNHLIFDLQLAYGEDMLFFMQYSIYCHSLRVIGESAYHYRLSVTDSLSLRKRSLEELMLQYSKHLLAFKEIMKYEHDEKLAIRCFLKAALCEMLLKYDVSCAQILERNIVLKNLFDNYFRLADKVMYLKFPRFAVWYEQTIKRAKRFISNKLHHV